ncbi:MAG TPA: hypothetical protein VIN71_06060, partial [Pseudomonadales bacterium]
MLNIFHQIKNSVLGLLLVFAALPASSSSDDNAKNASNGGDDKPRFYMVESPAGEEYCQKLLTFTNETYFNERGELVEQLEWKSLKGKKYKVPNENANRRIRSFYSQDSY